MQILVVEDKHDTSYYAADTEEHLYAAALKIVKERYSDGWYYSMGDEVAWLHKALDGNNPQECGMAAWRLLKARRDYEYERCYLDDVFVVEPANV